MTRVVWAIKGLLGRPVVAMSSAPRPPAPQPPYLRPPRRGYGDLELKMALEALSALQVRVSHLERQERTTPDATLSAPGPAGPPTLWSVIVPTLDRAPWLDRALWGLAYQGHPAFEIVVVRGPCSDDTDAVLARHAIRIRVVDCLSANISAARNAGLAVARGEAVAFLDDDAVPEPDWLERLAEGLVDPGAAGVGGPIRDATGIAFQCRTMLADRFGTSRDLGAYPSGQDAPGPGAERYLSLTGANSAFRRAALAAIGGFDEAFAYFLDETDVCLRLVEAGWRLAVVAEAEVHHAYAESAQRDAAGVPRRLADCACSTAYFVLRHAAPHHGLTAATAHLATYADGLARDTAWRAEHGVITPSDADRMLKEIEDGVLRGTRAALAAPARTGGWRLEPQPRVDGPPPSPTLRPAAERLRLALLCQDYPGEQETERPPGGIAVWGRALAEVLARRGHEVSIFARASTSASTVRFESIGEGGLWLHRVGAGVAAVSRVGALLAGAPPSVARPAQAQAAEVMRVSARRRFDLALGPLWGLEPAALIGRAPFPVTVSLHTACAQLAVDRPEWSDAYRRSHVDRVTAAERRLLAAAPYLLANSRTALADLAAAMGRPELPDRATVLAHGLPDLATGVRPAARGAGVEFLFVGRFERRKGVDTLLDAAPALLAAAPNVRLTLVGEETGLSLAEGFRERHAGAPWLGRIAFLGPLARTALLARYAACDAVLMPSRYESFGLVALEAMIFAKPCIVGDAGGLRDVVVDGETGMHVQPGDPSALTAAILALTSAPERRAAMGHAARRRYLDHYTDTKMAEGFETWVKGVIGREARLLAAE